MEIIERQHNVLKKASGSWAEPYSACPRLMPGDIKVYPGYTGGFKG